MIGGPGCSDLPRTLPILAVKGPCPGAPQSLGQRGGWVPLRLLHPFPLFSHREAIGFDLHNSTLLTSVTFLGKTEGALGAESRLSVPGSFDGSREKF